MLLLVLVLVGLPWQRHLKSMWHAGERHCLCLSHCPPRVPSTGVLLLLLPRLY
jgi:hypothetical protein